MSRILIHGISVMKQNTSTPNKLSCSRTWQMRQSLCVCHWNDIIVQIHVINDIPVGAFNNCEGVNDAVPNTPIKRQWINDYNYDHDTLSGVLWDGVKEASCGDKSKIFRMKITYNSLHLTYNHGVWLNWSSGCGVCSLWWRWNWISIFFICKTNHLSTITCTKRCYFTYQNEVWKLPMMVHYLEYLLTMDD